MPKRKDHILNHINAFHMSTSSDKQYNDMVCKLTGVTFDGRQEAIGKITHYTKLRLVRQYDNKYDTNAIIVEALVDNTWKEIGFIPRALNSDLAQSMDAGNTYGVTILSIYGDGNTPKGVRVGIKKQ